MASAICGDAIKLGSVVLSDRPGATYAYGGGEARTRSVRRALLPHIARAEVAALIVQWRTNPHLKYHLFRSSGVKLVLKCRDNYSGDRRNTQKNVPEVVKGSVCAREGSAPSLAAKSPGLENVP